MKAIIISIAVIAGSILAVSAPANAGCAPYYYAGCQCWIQNCDGR